MQLGFQHPLPKRIPNPLPTSSLPVKGERREQTETRDTKGSDCESLIAFLDVSIDRDSMGQQLRVRAKRKRRLAYLQRKKVTLRATATRPTPSKQQTQKESAAAK